MAVRRIVQVDVLHGVDNKLALLIRRRDDRVDAVGRLVEFDRVVDSEPGLAHLRVRILDADLQARQRRVGDARIHVRGKLAERVLLDREAHTVTTRCIGIPSIYYGTYIICANKICRPA